MNIFCVDGLPFLLHLRVETDLLPLCYGKRFAIDSLVFKVAVVLQSIVSGVVLTFTKVVTFGIGTIPDNFHRSFGRCKKTYSTMKMKI